MIANKVAIEVEDDYRKTEEDVLNNAIKFIPQVHTLKAKKFKVWISVEEMSDPL